MHFRTYISLLSDNESTEDDQEQEMIQQAIEESLREM